MNVLYKIEEDVKQPPLNPSKFFKRVFVLRCFTLSLYNLMLLLGTKYVQDGPRQINEARHYSLVLLVVIWIVCALAVIVALALFYFNFKNREIR